MIIIYKDYILKYIHLLTPNHIIEFCKANNIYITKDEVLVLYKFILENYKGLLDDSTTINNLKPLIRKNLYSYVYKTYKEYKTKYII